MNIHLNRRSVIAGMAAMTATPLIGSKALAQAKPFEGRTLVSTGFGGSTMDIVADAVFKPFDAQTGATTTQMPMQSNAALARMIAEKGSPQIDMYQFSGGQEVDAVREGLTQAIAETDQIDALAADMRDPDGNWVAWAVIAEGLVYRTDKFDTPPTSYQDFFRPELKGHIAFPAITNGYGTDFLVMLAKTFGGSEDNIDPGFEAMAKLKDETIFAAASDIPTLFGQGDIWLMPYDTGNTYKNQQAGLPIAFTSPKEGSPAVKITACIAKDAANADVASAAIDRMLSPEAQIKIAEGMRWTPTNPNTKLPADLAQHVPDVTQLVSLDRAKINESRAAWIDRWNREIAS
ncbi:extracellular solute-binding protein [Tianweitania sp. BSSL-BM11]|uniref:Extracellular solute-binding protein n=1 Tax=Tianweitania aestuarii TaxID=2814886 RepID=A0ABS5RWD6_9HYPH|nr:extracellular solute-binding protein [Tianweitania aestuarii]MBS9721390.1 extracellular solute-binding protein [Tianweitania aestuarii]